MSPSPNTNGNIVLSAGLAFLLILSWGWPAINRLLLPYHKEGDYSKVGFVRLKLIRAEYNFTVTVFHRFIMPVFTTIYLFNLIVLEAGPFTEGLHQPEDLYFMSGLWAMVMLLTGSTIPLLLMMAVTFGIGYLIAGSVYGGCVGAVIILTIFFAYSHYEVDFFEAALSNVEKNPEKNLGGTNIFLIKIKFFFRRLRLIFTLLVMIFTLVQLMLNSHISASGIVLTYLGTRVDNAIKVFVFLVAFTNISFRVFTGRIFSYLQIDLLTRLGEIIRFHKEHPDSSKADIADGDQQEEEDNEIETDSTMGKRSVLTETDKVINLRNVSVPHFKTALSFYSVDILLTLVTIFNISIIPSTTPENMSTLSSLVKIPFYIVFIILGMSRFTVWLRSKNIGVKSETAEEEVKATKKFGERLESLFRKIQYQQVKQSRYIDVSEDPYLLWLAGVPYNDKHKERINL